MKRILFAAFIMLLMVIGLGLLYLTNTGILSIGEPYVRKLSAELKPVDTPVAFTDVNVIPMDREQVLSGQTVLVENGSITAIRASSEVVAPAGALIIDGSGKYLIPGLVDMHVHIEDENDLLLYVANGVTTVRNMWGNTEKKSFMGMPDQLILRDLINKGELLGPTIYTSGPIMEGNPPAHSLMPIFETPQQAAESIAWQKERGYDFIKVYDNLSKDVYQAILQAADQYGLPVTGHVPSKVGLEKVLSGGQVTIEHLTGYIDPDAAEFLIPEDKLSIYAEMTKNAGVWNCPTIGLYQNTVPPDEIDRLEAQPGVEYMSPLMRMLMRFFIGQLGNSVSYTGLDYPARIEEIYTRMTSILHDAGANLILCTDTSNSYLVPGYSLHRELSQLIKAGLTPYEAIQAGTYNAAEAIGKLDQFGTVEVGKRADLILLNENPLVDVSNIQNRSGVMLRGRWLTESQLQGMLTSLADSYRPNMLERVWPLSFVAIAIFLIWLKSSIRTRT